ncbi:MAG: amidohydrolase family protein [Pseudomonadales bacterium]
MKARLHLLIMSLVLLCNPAFAATPIEGAEPGEELISIALAMGLKQPPYAKQRGIESEGPFARLIIKNAMMLDGSGAPLQGPVNIEIVENRIVSVSVSTGEPQPSGESGDVKVIDAAGKYVMPGLIDMHFHLGTPSHAYAGALTDPEYVLKLALAHGVTTVRDVGSIMGLKWTVQHSKLSAAGDIASPRIIPFAMFPEQFESESAARKWVRDVKKRGAQGVKMLGAPPEMIAAGIDEAKKLGMKTTMHHAQTAVTRTNVLDSARLGLSSMEHWYGLPEAMFADKRIQQYPLDYNYSNEQHRFAEAGKLWLQAAKPGSDVWKATIAELTGLDFTIDPTFTIYEANRDLQRAKSAPWHDEYTMPYMMRAFQSNPLVHGSYFFDWTTAHEVAWKKNYRRWMLFVNDFKNAGGRVTAGSDAGFIYKVYGFAYIRELELLQEAGFHPLEVLQSATINGAQLLGMDGTLGSIQVGKVADLVIVDENPIENFKVLYGTGHEKLNLDTNIMETTGGIRYTVRDGIVFDAKLLLQQVRDLVSARKSLEEKSSVQ